MSTRIFSTLKYAGLFLAVIGLGLTLLSPFIGEPVTPDLLWWIEPVAYVGAGLFIFGAIVGYVSVKFNSNSREERPDGRTWSQITQDYFDTFAHDMGRPLRRILGKQREARALLNETGEVTQRKDTDLLDEIENQAPNFRVMIENVRVLVDLEDQSASPAIEPVDIAAIVRNVSDRYSPIARDRGIDLIWWC